MREYDLSQHERALLDAWGNGNCTPSPTYLGEVGRRPT
jgi:hypothetical protein